MSDCLKCSICGEEIENCMVFLEEHLEQHIKNYEEEAVSEGEDVMDYVLSFFDGEEE